MPFHSKVNTFYAIPLSILIVDKILRAAYSYSKAFHKTNKFAFLQCKNDNKMCFFFNLVKVITLF